MKIVLFCLTILGLVSTVRGWWDMGHILCMEIARRQLTENTKIDIATLIEPAITRYYFPGEAEIPWAAVWMDTLKHDTNLMSPMHYINHAYTPAQYVTNYTAPALPLVNLEWALTAIGTTLITKKDTAQAWGKALSILMFLHLAGDLHQPFHNIGMFSPVFPTGDLGGNLYQLNYTSTEGEYIDNMHSLFDSVAGWGAGYMPDPITPVYAEEIALRATQLINTYPATNYNQTYLYPDLSTASKFTTVVEDWSQEGYALAKQWGYDKIPQNSKVAEATATQIREVLQERIAIAGYRIAHAIISFDLSVHGPVAPIVYTLFDDADDDHSKNALIIVSILLGLTWVLLLLRYLHLTGKLCCLCDNSAKQNFVTSGNDRISALMKDVDIDLGVDSLSHSTQKTKRGRSGSNSHARKDSYFSIISDSHV